MATWARRRIDQRHSTIPLAAASSHRFDGRCTQLQVGGRAAGETQWVTAEGSDRTEPARRTTAPNHGRRLGRSRSERHVVAPATIQQEEVADASSAGQPDTYAATRSGAVPGIRRYIRRSPRADIERQARTMSPSRSRRVVVSGTTDWEDPCRDARTRPVRRVTSIAAATGPAVAEPSSASPPATTPSRSPSGSTRYGSTIDPDTVAEWDVATTSGTAAGERSTTLELPRSRSCRPTSRGRVDRGEWEVRRSSGRTSMPEDVTRAWDDRGTLRLRTVGAGLFLTGASQRQRRSRVWSPRALRSVAVIGTECSTVEPPPYFGRTEDELRACATVERRVHGRPGTLHGQEVVDLGVVSDLGSRCSRSRSRSTTSWGEPGVAQAVSETYSPIIARAASMTDSPTMIVA